MNLFVIADDFTGANDIGVQLSKFGLKVITSYVGNKDSTLSDVKVIDTESRNIDENEAYNIVKKIVEESLNENSQKIYKKIDSTMRGNIKTEIKALLDTGKFDFIPFVVGFPDVGRYVIDGKLYVNDELIHNTSFSKDPFCPIKSSEMIELVGQGEVITVEEINDNVIDRLSSVREKVVIFDTKTNQDLEIIAETLVKLKKDRIVVGSSGIMGHLPKYWNLKKNKVLTIAGSCNDINIEQIDEFILSDKKGIKVVEFDIKNPNLEKITDEFDNILLRSIREKREMQETIDYFKEDSQIKNLGEYISEKLVEEAVEIINEEEIKDIMVSGGDIAIKLIKSLGLQGLVIEREVEPGICVSRSICGKYRIITKPGGFGSKKIYKKCNEILKSVENKN